MNMKTDNPFDGWQQQCFGLQAVDEYGREVPPEATIASMHCAVGWIAKTRLLEEIGGVHLWREFNHWFYMKHMMSLIEANDVHHKPPSWFREQWNAFLDTPIRVDGVGGRHLARKPEPGTPR